MKSLNFKMLLVETEIEETIKSEIDETYLFLVILKPEFSINKYLKKYNENRYIDCYVPFQKFMDYSNRKYIICLKNIEIIGSSEDENSFLIKIDRFDTIDINDIRKDKIKNILD